MGISAYPKPGTVQAADQKAVFVDNRGQAGGYAPGSANVVGWGLLAAVTNSGSAADGLDGDGPFLKHTSNATANSIASVRCGNNTGPLLTRRDLNGAFLFKFGLDHTTNLRIFVGLTNLVQTTMLQNDDPSGQYVGLQFSTPRGDTNWQFVTDDGTTQAKQDSGSAQDTAARYLRITIEASVPSIKLELLDAAFALLASHAFGSNLPGATDGLYVLAGVLTTTASAKAIRHYYGYGENRI